MVVIRDQRRVGVKWGKKLGGHRWMLVLLTSISQLSVFMHKNPLAH
ncbi:MAG: hypothetical protein OJF51_004477 [Nitrospira sp.]|jgi:hypothetical protein|nr:MAG: hypothetical protein OJF51_004477 [Nitrospira sp.]